jgi:hypothetical protein
VEPNLHSSHGSQAVFWLFHQNIFNMQSRNMAE